MGKEMDSGECGVVWGSVVGSVDIWISRWKGCMYDGISNIFQSQQNHLAGSDNSYTPQIVWPSEVTSVITTDMNV